MTEDQALSEAELQEFLNTYSNWELKDGWIRRKYGTPGWSHTLMLVNTIGYLAEAGNHHPDLRNFRHIKSMPSPGKTSVWQKKLKKPCSGNQKQTPLWMGSLKNGSTDSTRFG